MGHACPALTDSYLPAVLSITENRTEGLYGVESGLSRLTANGQERPVMDYDALDDVDGRERHDEHDRLIERRTIDE